MRSARTFAATVAAKHAEGAVLRADDGPILLLPPNVDLGQAMRIVFAFEPLPAAVGAPRAESPFEVIDSLKKLLGRGGTLGARSSIVRLLPRPDKGFSVLAAAFLGALQGGDAGAWLGSEAGARLTHDLPELHERLRAACSNARAGEAEATEEWQTWTIPVLTSSGLSPLRVYRRQGAGDREGAGDDEGQPTVRVIFDCTFTRVGRVQVDTLCRKPKGCDVMIRTEAPLEPSVRDALNLAYADTAATVGLVGKLGFRAAKGAFVGPGATSRTAGPLSLSV